MGIRVTPVELHGMAKDMRTHAGKAEALAAEIETTVRKALDAWEGNAQKDYEARFREVLPTLKTQLPELIRSMATDADNRATRYEEADS